MTFKCPPLRFSLRRQQTGDYMFVCLFVFLDQKKTTGNCDTNLSNVEKQLEKKHVRNVFIISVLFSLSLSFYYCFFLQPVGHGIKNILKQMVNLG